MPTPPPADGAVRPPLTIGGDVLAERLLRERAALVEEVKARLLEEVPYYRVLPREQLAGDITEVVRHNLVLFADVLRRRRPRRGADCANWPRPRCSGPRRAYPSNTSSPPTTWGCGWCGDG
ncbi:hypothetical protein [Streptomyces somaliensis]|uniref:hypothetical protein n=1 Tax=Streptomyces somaliensis TaxID=78355 RepID=UPI0034E937D7|nr:hypothetical protein [Streptomyces somaliensis]